jgi:hypothetical protein
MSRPQTLQKRSLLGKIKRPYDCRGSVKREYCFLWYIKGTQDEEKQNKTQHNMCWTPYLFETIRSPSWPTWHLISRNNLDSLPRNSVTRPARNVRERFAINVVAFQSDSTSEIATRSLASNYLFGIVKLFLSSFVQINS